MSDRPRFGFPIGPWLQGFAWLPTWTYDAGTVWLCRVYARHCQKYHHLDGGPMFFWQYRRFPPGDPTP